MKKFLIVVMVILFALAFGPALFADQMNHGCGLGAYLFKGKDGFISYTLATTTNGICCNQTFGVTFGTLECKKASGIVSNEKINKFVADNMDNLAKDIARGNGEYLNTLVVLMEVAESNRTQLHAKLQSNFSKIYTSDKVTHREVLNNIEKVMKSS